MINQLGSLTTGVEQRMVWHDQNKTIQRLFKHDISLWHGTGEPDEEIANRLGWLNLPSESVRILPELNALSDKLILEGYTTAVLLGMGGSSLAPFVISQTLAGFGSRPENALSLIVLDTTHPDAIDSISQSIDIDKTIFIVSTKSGTTSETLALSDYFWDFTARSASDHPGLHFIAITDPGSKVIDTAKQKQYRATFLANPDVGGRYSALSVFGLLPARLAGVELDEFLKSARKAADLCGPSTPDQQNPGLLLGTILAEAWSGGIDKVVFISDTEVESFGVWAEQLLAESSGKNNKGIVPVSSEPIVSPADYSSDRLFVYLRSSGDHDNLVRSLLELKHPCLVYDVRSINDLAAQFYTWEIATAVACSLLEVNAFDQPNVQESKTITKNKIDLVRSTGKLEKSEPLYADPGIEIYWKNISDKHLVNFESILNAFLAQAHPADYFAVNAFVPATSENVQILQYFRRMITEKKKIATTLGFGPRYLHSTGQLHKGGANNGLFLVITQDATNWVDIPGNDISFNQLILAQAAGDIEALINRGRRVIHIHLLDPGEISVFTNIR